MNNKYFFFLASIALFITSCNLFRQSSESTVAHIPVLNMDTVTILLPDSASVVYRASQQRTNDLLHTKLEVKFDWEKALLFGKALITVKPYFYPVDHIDLDARGFDIHEVALLADSSRKQMKYIYDKEVLSIKLDRTYTRNETFRIYVDYTAKPNELKVKGSSAIDSDKGLYFINHDGKDKNKPKQVWTQGETQSNSAWFPTIDSPNERMTDELYITVDKKYVTLSNGELVFSTDNGDSTRTDYWKMDLPHAPYLVMMAIGDFAVVKDNWREKEVSYYVEKKYEPYAKAIFGKTPEMIELFSEKLGVAYPWNKYAQVVVRDYVSGAMENTTATLHGEFMQRTKRELLDENNEDVISHELFHQWFGDLVTCESWSNLPLNESFATYGEYLWREYKYGRDDADQHLQQDLESYLSEANFKQMDMIRFYYTDKEDMFDSHSYAKGGRILHLLRNHVGDEAFFASLKLYLETNKFSSVEIHDLRLVFEQVTGEDLNWFFNQWFLSSGHPELEIECNYNPAAGKEIVSIKQTQDIDKTPVFRLPVAVDIYVNGSKERHNIIITKRSEDFSFNVPSKPDLVNVDAEKILLCKKREKKTINEWAFQYNNAPLYLDRKEAIDALGSLVQDSLAKATVIKALTDNYWGIRKLAIKKLGNSRDSLIKEKLIALAQKDEKPAVRSSAIATLDEYKDTELMPVFKNGITDSAYSVISASLSAITHIDSLESLKLAKQFDQEDNEGIILAVAEIYSQSGTDSNNDFFLAKSEKIEKFMFLNLYTEFLKRCKDETIDKGLPVLGSIAKNTDSKWVKYMGEKALNDLLNMYEEREQEIGKKIKKLKAANNIDNAELKISEQHLVQIKKQEQKINELLNSLKQK